MKLVFTGLESSGKSLLMSRTAEKVFRRNRRWHKILTKLGKPCPRTMAFNQPMSDTFIKKIEDAGLIYQEWKNFDEIEYNTQSDIFIDELLKIFPSRGSDPLPPHVMDFLTQGAKSGNHIYATSQDFSQVHKQFRLLTNRVYTVKKLFGSPRPMNSMPPVPFVWGLGLKFSVAPDSFKGESASMQPNFIPMPFLISKRDTMRYNTLYKVPSAQLPDRKLRPYYEIKLSPTGQIIDRKLKYK